MGRTTPTAQTALAIQFLAMPSRDRATIGRQIRELIEEYGAAPSDDAANLLSIRTPSDAMNLLHAALHGLEQEELHVLSLNTKNQVIEHTPLYRGSLNMAALRIAEIFRAAIRCNAASIILAHNHPSGDPTPSPQDIASTREIVAAGKLLDIDVLDHIIIGNRGRNASLKQMHAGFD